MYFILNNNFPEQNVHYGRVSANFLKIEKVMAVCMPAKEGREKGGLEVEKGEKRRAEEIQLC